MSSLPAIGAAAAPAADTWLSTGGWQGGGIGEISHPASAPPRDASHAGSGAPGGPRYRPGRAGARDSSGGPPWEPAPQPQPAIGLLPAAAASSPPPEPGARIRVPGDMADPPGETTDPALPRFDLSRPPEGFDLSTPAFGLTPAGFGRPRPRSSGRPGPTSGRRRPTPAWPSRSPSCRPGQSVDFAAAPVPTDYPHLPPGDDAAGSGPAGSGLAGSGLAGSGSGPAGSGRAADPSFIWNLAATDVFPAAAPGSGPPPLPADTRPEPVLRPGVLPPGVLPPDDPADAGGSSTRPVRRRREPRPARHPGRAPAPAPAPRGRRPPGARRAWRAPRPARRPGRARCAAGSARW